MAGDDFILSGSESAMDLSLPANQIPAPPLSQTVKELENELDNQKSTLDDFQKGFGATTITYPTRAAFEAAKIATLKLVQTTIPAQIKSRKAWDDKYSVKRSRAGGDAIVMDAVEVYRIQQAYKAASDDKNPAVKKYIAAVNAVASLEKAFEKSGSPESKLSPANQQLALAAAWKKVQAAITPEIKKLRSENFPLVIDLYGRTEKSSGFTLAVDVPKSIDAAIQRSIKFADEETTTQVVGTKDKYGRPLTYISTKTPEQVAQYEAFIARAKGISETTDVAIAEKLANPTVTVKAPVVAPTVTPTTTPTTTPPTTTPTTTPTTPTTTTPTTTTPTTTTPTTTTTTTPSATDTGVVEPAASDGGGVTAKAKRADVIAGLAALKLPDTAANRQTVRDQIKAGKLPNIRNLPADVSGTGFDTGWQDRFKKEYPAYAWMLTELDQTKYSDLFQLMNDAVKPGSEYTDELFQRKFIGTSWYTELAAGQTGRELTKGIGAFSWGEGQLAKFLTTATRMGYTDATLKSKAYEALFSKGADGKYVNPNAIGEVKASSPFLTIKKIGTAFLTPISDESVIDTLVGGRSSDDIMRTSRELAKAKFPHLANAIDAGVTLEDITYGYKRDAAQLLEVDANTIDMSAGGYSAALGSMKDPMMSTAEWAAYIKGTPSFGWQFTKQANQQATDVGLTLARAFGKVK
jgi:hypothetical protein